ncbi:MAG: YlbF family regulator [Clostridiales bacterium]|nr:YlbF family regulator [Clostridiales bacterium]MCF8023261.1 YlbF family regulator [Clostridiales bacterium]
MSNPVLEKARELGDELVKSKELTEMRDAQEKVMQNQEAKAILDQFHEKQKVLYDMQNQGQEITEGHKKEVEEIEQKMMDNNLLAEFIKTQQSFEKVLQSINDMISQAISGEKESSCESCCPSCDSGCDA